MKWTIRGSRPIRNRSTKSGKWNYPVCIHCECQLNMEDRISSWEDDRGFLHAKYRCPRCGKVTPVVYNGPDASHWMIYEDIKSTPETRAPLPKCPQCEKMVEVIDMKYSDLDEYGNLYEAYRCGKCGERFSITYNGPDDTYDWEYDE